ncbi:HAD-IIB family hydrolase [Rhodoferax antarcticus]|uniref:HAD-superfamily hydrolase, subfamily IIB n=1 Tax=Rhodoferax antarcticus ANT.BR TaxID=1111071 RepID=A0A1Q8YLB1_9BURK|nr:HAD-IIB family hydrolase [Rhodoferax antarcticus]APW48488.1 HAD family hydrolase [Rhodoferax antarcticus]OLP08690.1 HAD-superfamily hydrolase, subfamily IIB [Rhodoferax antarcticus ANT.BR]
MLPLAQWPLAERQKIIGVFTDIDDTLTTHQAITAEALQALADLKAAGLAVIPITGRPVGWCAPHALGDAAHGLPAWAVDAMVAENGGVAFAPKVNDENGFQPLCNKREQLSKIYYANASYLAANQLKMRQVAELILQQVPGSALSGDHAGRETDTAIDYNEVHRLNPDQVAQVVALFEAHGMQATVSSIHINGWIGSHNKLEAARWMVRRLFGRDLDAELSQWVYVGDSTNDQVMFEHFVHSVGVANIHRFAGQMVHWPRYETAAERGAGFAEVARALLEARAA